MKLFTTLVSEQSNYVRLRSVCRKPTAGLVFSSDTFEFCQQWPVLRANAGSQDEKYRDWK